MRLLLTTAVLAILLGGCAMQQSDPLRHSNALKAQLRFELPAEITTIGASALYFLEPHGYTLALGAHTPPESRSIVIEPLPAPLPWGRVMSIEDALLVITRDHHRVVIDHANKLVSFAYADPEQEGTL